jgi:anhydro-N-acetylmuramic acid kinase
MGFKRMKEVGVIGLMSGTSLDGLDLCYAVFEKVNSQWIIHEIITKEVAYTDEWKNLLKNAFFLDELDLKKLHEAYGKFLGEEVNQFRKESLKDKTVSLISSHGHTIYHQPEKGITVQIGDGNKIAKETGLLVVNDFRIGDVSLGGQGAPLVPIGDELLFGQYEACLNLGGISNISFRHHNQRVAFDICPCNLPLNKLMSHHFQVDFDKNGAVAKSGKILTELLNELNGLAYYSKTFPKSLGIEWLNQHFYPIIDTFLLNHSVEDVLRTIVEHEAVQIAQVLNFYQIKNVLTTGGGAFNGFLIHLIKEKTTAEIVLPQPQIIASKEALIFAFLGLLNLREEINILKSVTGAVRDSIGGTRCYQ